MIIADKIRDQKLQYDIKRENCTKNKRFPLTIAPTNVAKSAAFCGFGHIYCRNL